MFNLIIPLKKSYRYPHKNSILIKYTLSWLTVARKQCVDDLCIIAVGDRDEIVDCGLMTSADHVVYTAAQSMQDDVALVEQMYPADYHILLQLTQPVREASLLARTITQIKFSGGKTLISATECRDDSWRVLNTNGVWSSKTDRKCLKHDGVIYAWAQGNSHEIFERTTRHDVIISTSTLPMVDVDYREDVPLDLDVLFEEALRR